MKDCKKIHPLLSLYEEGELSARETALVEKHVSGCPVAREELDRLERLRRMLRKSPPPEVPYDLHDKIMAKLGRKTERKVLWFNPAWTLAAAAAALAIIVMTQYPSLTGGRNENLSLNKTAPAGSTPSSSKDLSAASSHSTGYQDQLIPGNKPMVLAMKRKAASKKESEEIEPSSNVEYKLAKSAASVASSSVTMELARKATSSSDIKKNFDASAQPTMVVAMAPAPAMESAEEPSRAKKAVKMRSAVKADVPEEAPPEAKASVQAAMPSIATGAAASSAQSGALDKDLNTNFAYAPQQPKTSWSGSYSPVTVESQELITDAATFQTEWNKVQLGQPLPPVDLTTQAVVLLNAGEKPTTGYSIQLSRSEETANQLIIHYQVLVPAPGAITGQMVTHPWVLQAIPKPVKPVVFQKD